MSAIDDLVTANHILHDHAVVDAFGHVSVRQPERSDHFLLARAMAPSLVGAADIVAYSPAGEPAPGETRRSYVERFIHSEIYRARPDVTAIVHSHAISVIPFTVSSVALRPVFHMAGFLAALARFDIQDVAGRPTDLLVSDPALGRALAAALGDANVVLMRGHGWVAVGRSLAEAVYRAIYTEVNARVQANALALGGAVRYLDETEARLCDATIAANLSRPWELWTRAARAGR